MDDSTTSRSPCEARARSPRRLRSIARAARMPHSHCCPPATNLTLPNSRPPLHGGSVQQGLSAARRSRAPSKRSAASDKRYSLAYEPVTIAIPFAHVRPLGHTCGRVVHHASSFGDSHPACGGSQRAATAPIQLAHCSRRRHGRPWKGSGHLGLSAGFVHSHSHSGTVSSLYAQMQLIRSNKSFDAEAQEHPCAARTRLLCAGQVRRQTS